MDRAFLARLSALVAGAILCALACGLILVPTPWRDPFVLHTWIGLTLFGAFVGFGCAMFTLWETKLSYSMPLVIAATILGLGVGVIAAPSMSVVLAFVAGCAAMSWCRRYAALRTNGSGGHSESVNRDAIRARMSRWRAESASQDGER